MIGLLCLDFDSPQFDAGMSRPCAACVADLSQDATGCDKVETSSGRGGDTRSPHSGLRSHARPNLWNRRTSRVMLLATRITQLVIRGLGTVMLVLGMLFWTSNA